MKDIQGSELTGQVGVDEATALELAHFAPVT